MLAVVALLGTLPATAQKLDPITWTLTLEPTRAAAGSEVLGKLSAKMEAGWHLYSLTTPRPPIATSVTVTATPAIGPAKVYQPKPERKLDPNFGSETETFEHDTVFLLRISIAKDAASGDSEISAQVRYQACNDKLCLPPVRRTAVAKLTVASGVAPASITIPPDYTEAAQRRTAAPVTAAPVTPATASSEPQSFGTFVLVAFGFGLAAVFTPCVFPMIPITMSFFLKKGTTTRTQSIFQAGIFALGIIVLFTVLGLATTALLGPFGVVQLGSNPWVNTFIAVIFAGFALSLLGAFEITIPSSVLTRMDQASQGGGVIGTLLMGLTFSLTSFACVGPFVGTLLAASVQGGKLMPAIGMFAFATGLASPFFFLALFPSLLQRMPRSGGWLARVKVVLGFVVLAAALKYLSNIDQVYQWNFLTRERFLAAWFVLFALPGLYLLGFLRLEGVKPEDKLGVSRLLIGASFLIFAISLLPGMFGGRLGELDAYVPAASGGSIGSSNSAEGGQAWMKNEYDAALEKGRQENKLVLVGFTGYACTNCHWMKANMFTRPEIATALKSLVLVELYTDGADEASQKNQQLQEQRFATIAIPYYALLNADGKVVATFAGVTRNSEEFLAFLKKTA